MANQMKSVVLFTILINIGCEGFVCSEGVIVDKTSREPVDSVFCKAITGSEEQLSDVFGHYEICNNFSGCVPKCDDLEVEFSKDGYKTQVVTNPDKDTIFLEKM